MSERVKSAGRSQSRGTTSKSLRPLGSEGVQQRKVVGDYMLGKTIGEGTFGKVKLAIHLPTGEKVAIKILEKSKIKEQADVRRVNREIKILKKARHPNIIQLYEVLDTRNSIYLIMECAEGGEMFDYIVAQHHVPEIQACKFFHQIVDGVESIHKSDITHRDLKPENLLLKASPNGWIVKIVDFGLSNTHEGGKMLSTACGSPCYAAPEMIAGKQYEGPLADLWSMGVILFALVCGYLPFEDPNTSILYQKILSGEYNAPKYISVEVNDIIRRILETDPKKRYKISDIRNHPWYKMVSNGEIPKESTTVQEAEIIRTQTLKALSESGVDVQAVGDGIASHACNALTAHYYLYEQKFRNMRAKLKERAIQNGEDLDYEEPQLVVEKRVEIQDSNPKPIKPNTDVVSPRPQIRGPMNIAAIKANCENQPPNIENRAVSPRPVSTSPQKVVLPTRAIFRPNQGSSNQEPERANIIGNNLRVNKPRAKTPGSVYHSNNPVSSLISSIVPRINIKGIHNLEGHVLSSQTARPKTGGNPRAPNNQNMLFVPNLPQSARMASPIRGTKDPSAPQDKDDTEPLVKPIELLGPFMDEFERPETRRSKMRSRGGTEKPVEESPGEGLIPDVPVDATEPEELNSPAEELEKDNLTAYDTNAIRAPEAASRSSASQGGRRGRNIVNTQR